MSLIPSSTPFTHPSPSLYQPLKVIPQVPKMHFCNSSRKFSDEAIKLRFMLIMEWMPRVSSGIMNWEHEVRFIAY